MLGASETEHANMQANEYRTCARRPLSYQGPYEYLVKGHQRSTPQECPGGVNSFLDGDKSGIVGHLDKNSPELNRVVG